MAAEDSIINIILKLGTAGSGASSTIDELKSVFDYVKKNNVVKITPEFEVTNSKVRDLLVPFKDALIAKVKLIPDTEIDPKDRSKITQGINSLFGKVTKGDQTIEGFSNFFKDVADLLTSFKVPDPFKAIAATLQEFSTRTVVDALEQLSSATKPAIETTNATVIALDRLEAALFDGDTTELTVSAFKELVNVLKLADPENLGIKFSALKSALKSIAEEFGLTKKQSNELFNSFKEFTTQSFEVVSSKLIAAAEADLAKEKAIVEQQQQLVAKQQEIAQKKKAIVEPSVDSVKEAPLDSLYKYDEFVSLQGVAKNLGLGFEALHGVIAGDVVVAEDFLRVLTAIKENLAVKGVPTEFNVAAATQYLNLSVALSKEYVDQHSELTKSFETVRAIREVMEQTRKTADQTAIRKQRDLSLLAREVPKGVRVEDEPDDGLKLDKPLKQAEKLIAALEELHKISDPTKFVSKYEAWSNELKTVDKNLVDILNKTEAVQLANHRLDNGGKTLPTDNLKALKQAQDLEIAYNGLKESLKLPETSSEGFINLSKVLRNFDHSLVISKDKVLAFKELLVELFRKLKTADDNDKSVSADFAKRLGFDPKELEKLAEQTEALNNNTKAQNLNNRAKLVVVPVPRNTSVKNDLTPEELAALQERSNLATIAVNALKRAITEATSIPVKFDLVKQFREEFKNLSTAARKTWNDGSFKEFREGPEFKVSSSKEAVAELNSILDALDNISKNPSKKAFQELSEKISKSDESLQHLVKSSKEYLDVKAQINKLTQSSTVVTPTVITPTIAPTQQALPIVEQTPELKKVIELVDQLNEKFKNLGKNSTAEEFIATLKEIDKIYRDINKVKRSNTDQTFNVTIPLLSFEALKQLQEQVLTLPKTEKELQEFVNRYKYLLTDLTLNATSTDFQSYRNFAEVFERSAEKINTSVVSVVTSLSELSEKFKTGTGSSIDVAESIKYISENIETLKAILGNSEATAKFFENIQKSQGEVIQKIVEENNVLIDSTKIVQELLGKNIEVPSWLKNYSKQVQEENARLRNLFKEHGEEKPEKPRVLTESERESIAITSKLADSLKNLANDSNASKDKITKTVLAIKKSFESLSNEGDQLLFFSTLKDQLGSGLMGVLTSVAEKVGTLKTKANATRTAFNLLVESLGVELKTSLPSSTALDSGKQTAINEEKDFKIAITETNAAIQEQKRITALHSLNSIMDIQDTDVNRTLQFFKNAAATKIESDQEIKKSSESTALALISTDAQSNQSTRERLRLLQLLVEGTVEASSKIKNSLMPVKIEQPVRQVVGELLPKNTSVENDATNEKSLELGTLIKKIENTIEVESALIKISTATTEALENQTKAVVAKSTALDGLSTKLQTFIEKERQAETAIKATVTALQQQSNVPAPASTNVAPNAAPVAPTPVITALTDIPTIVSKASTAFEELQKIIETTFANKSVIGLGKKIQTVIKDGEAHIAVLKEAGKAEEALAEIKARVAKFNTTDDNKARQLGIITNALGVTATSEMQVADAAKNSDAALNAQAATVVAKSAKLDILIEALGRLATADKKASEGSNVFIENSIPEFASLQTRLTAVKKEAEQLAASGDSPLKLYADYLNLALDQIAHIAIDGTPKATVAVKQLMTELYKALTDNKKPEEGQGLAKQIMDVVVKDLSNLPGMTTEALAALKSFDLQKLILDALGSNPNASELEKLNAVFNAVVEVVNAGVAKLNTVASDASASYAGLIKHIFSGKGQASSSDLEASVINRLKDTTGTFKTFVEKFVEDLEKVYRSGTLAPDQSQLSKFIESMFSVLKTKTPGELKAAFTDIQMIIAESVAHLFPKMNKNESAVLFTDMLAAQNEKIRAELTGLSSVFGILKPDERLNAYLDSFSEKKINFTSLEDSKIQLAEFFKELLALSNKFGIDLNDDKVAERINKYSSDLIKALSSLNGKASTKNVGALLERTLGSLRSQGVNVGELGQIKLSIKNVSTTSLDSAVTTAINKVAVKAEEELKASFASINTDVLKLNPKIDSSQIASGFRLIGKIYSDEFKTIRDSATSSLTKLENFNQLSFNADGAVNGIFTLRDATVKLNEVIKDFDKQDSKKYGLEFLKSLREFYQDSTTITKAIQSSFDRQKNDKNITEAQSFKVPTLNLNDGLAVLKAESEKYQNAIQTEITKIQDKIQAASSARTVLSITPNSSEESVLSKYVQKLREDEKKLLKLMEDSGKAVTAEEKKFLERTAPSIDYFKKLKTFSSKDSNIEIKVDVSSLLGAVDNSKRALESLQNLGAKAEIGNNSHLQAFNALLGTTDRQALELIPTFDSIGSILRRLFVTSGSGANEVKAAFEGLAVGVNSLDSAKFKQQILDFAGNSRVLKSELSEVENYLVNILKLPATNPFVSFIRDGKQALDLTESLNASLKEVNKRNKNVDTALASVKTNEQSFSIAEQRASATKAIADIEKTEQAQAAHAAALGVLDSAYRAYRNSVRSAETAVLSLTSAEIQLTNLSKGTQGFNSPIQFLPNASEIQKQVDAVRGAFNTLTEASNFSKIPKDFFQEFEQQIKKDLVEAFASKLQIPLNLEFADSNVKTTLQNQIEALISGVISSNTLPEALSKIKLFIEEYKKSINSLTKVGETDSGSSDILKFLTSLEKNVESAVANVKAKLSSIGSDSKLNVYQTQIKETKDALSSLEAPLKNVTQELTQLDSRIRSEGASNKLGDIAGSLERIQRETKVFQALSEGLDLTTVTAAQLQEKLANLKLSPKLSLEAIEAIRISFEELVKMGDLAKPVELITKPTINNIQQAEKIFTELRHQIAAINATKVDGKLTSENQASVEALTAQRNEALRLWYDLINVKGELKQISAASKEAAAHPFDSSKTGLDKYQRGLAQSVEHLNDLQKLLETVSADKMTPPASVLNILQAIEKQHRSIADLMETERKYWLAQSKTNRPATLDQDLLQSKPVQVKDTAAKQALEDLIKLEARRKALESELSKPLELNIDTKANFSNLIEFEAATKRIRENINQLSDSDVKSYLSAQLATLTGEFGAASKQASDFYKVLEKPVKGDGNLDALRLSINTIIAQMGDLNAASSSTGQKLLGLDTLEKQGQDAVTSFTKNVRDLIAQKEELLKGLTADKDIKLYNAVNDEVTDLKKTLGTLTNFSPLARLTEQYKDLRNGIKETVKDTDLLAEINAKLSTVQSGKVGAEDLQTRINALKEINSLSKGLTLDSKVAADVALLSKEIANLISNTRSLNETNLNLKTEDVATKLQSVQERIETIKEQTRGLSFANPADTVAVDSVISSLQQEEKALRSIIAAKKNYDDVLKTSAATSKEALNAELAYYKKVSSSNIITIDDVPIKEKIESIREKLNSLSNKSTKVSISTEDAQINIVTLREKFNAFRNTIESKAGEKVTLDTTTASTSLVFLDNLIKEVFANIQALNNSRNANTSLSEGAEQAAVYYERLKNELITLQRELSPTNTKKSTLFDSESLKSVKAEIDTIRVGIDGVGTAGDDAATRIKKLDQILHQLQVTKILNTDNTLTAGLNEAIESAQKLRATLLDTKVAPLEERFKAQELILQSLVDKAKVAQSELTKILTTGPFNETSDRALLPDLSPKFAAGSHSATILKEILAEVNNQIRAINTSLRNGQVLDVNVSTALEKLRTLKSEIEKLQGTFSDKKTPLEADFTKAYDAGMSLAVLQGKLKAGQDLLNNDNFVFGINPGTALSAYQLMAQINSEIARLEAQLKALSGQSSLSALSETFKADLASLAAMKVEVGSLSAAFNTINTKKMGDELQKLQSFVSQGLGTSEYDKAFVDLTERFKHQADLVIRSFGGIDQAVNGSQGPVKNLTTQIYNSFLETEKQIGQTIHNFSNLTHALEAMKVATPQKFFAIPDMEKLQTAFNENKLGAQLKQLGEDGKLTQAQITKLQEELVMLFAMGGTTSLEAYKNIFNEILGTSAGLGNVNTSWNLILETLKKVVAEQTEIQKLSSNVKQATTGNATNEGLGLKQNLQMGDTLEAAMKLQNAFRNTNNEAAGVFGTVQNILRELNKPYEGSMFNTMRKESFGPIKSTLTALKQEADAIFDKMQRLESVVPQARQGDWAAQLAEVRNIYEQIIVAIQMVTQYEKKASETSPLRDMLGGVKTSMAEIMEEGALFNKVLSSMLQRAAAKVDPAILFPAMAEKFGLAGGESGEKFVAAYTKALQGLSTLKLTGNNATELFNADTGNFNLAAIENKFRSLGITSEQILKAIRTEFEGTFNSSADAATHFDLVVGKVFSDLNSGFSSSQGFKFIADQFNLLAQGAENLKKYISPIPQELAGVSSTSFHLDTNAITQQLLSLRLITSDSVNHVRTALDSLNENKFASQDAALAALQQLLMGLGKTAAGLKPQLDAAFSGNLQQSVTRFSDAVKELETQLVKFRSGAIQWTMGVQMFGQGLFEPVQHAIEGYKQFSDTMGMVKSITGATNEQYKELTETAILMGGTTRYTAEQAADGLKYLAMAGYDVETSISVLPVVMRMAQTAAMDLGAAAEITTNIMTEFRMSAEEFTGAADVLAMAAAKTNATMQDLGYAFK